MEQAHAATAPIAPIPLNKRSKHFVIAAASGNFIEFFDFTVYSFFATIISEVYFESYGHMTGLVFSYLVFAIGFLTRPLGSIVLGSYGDRYGRKKAMMLTMRLMAVGSFIIAFAPTTALVGPIAPLFIILGRMIQGISSGGEVGASTTLILETSPPEKLGRYSAFFTSAGQAMSALCGSLLALYLLSVLDHETMVSWGWRVPFIISLSIIPISLYCRRHLVETLQDSEKKKENHPFYDLLKDHWRQVIKGILMIYPTTVANYVLIFYMPTLLNLVTGLDQAAGTRLSSLSCAIYAIAIFLGGYIFDRAKNIKRYMLINFLCLAFFSALTLASTNNLPVLYFFQFISITCLGIGCCTIIFIGLAFEKKLRTTAIAFIYALSVTIFGGTTQAFITYLLKLFDNNPMAPLIYVLFACTMGCIGLTLFNSNYKK